MSRPVGISIEGPPDPTTITAELILDLFPPPIIGVVEPGTRHFLFQVPDGVDGGFHVRGSADGFESVLYRHRDANGHDIPIQETDAELPIMILPPISVPVPVGRVGLVRTDKKVVLDDTGVFRALMWTWFWALQSFRNDRPRNKKNGDYMGITQGLFGPRILCEVGTGGNPNSSWAGNTIEPDVWGSDYETTLAGFLDYLRSIGKRVNLTVLGKGTDTDPLKLCNRIADVVLDGRMDLIQNIEMVNEFSAGIKVSIDTMVKMAKVFQKRGVPNVLSLSSPGNTAEFKALNSSAGSLGLKGFNVHPRRLSLDKGWSQPRQGYDNKDTKLKVNMDEPAGPGSSVEVQTDPLLLAMTLAVSTTCGGAEYTYHTGTGVYGDGKSHPSAGPRPPEFDQIPNIDAQLAALRDIDAFFAPTVPNWTVRNTQRAGVPFDLPKSMHWGVGYKGSSGFGVNKAYAAVSTTGAFVQVPCGVKTDDTHPCKMRAKFAMRDVSVVAVRAEVDGPVTFETQLDGEEFAIGEDVNLTGRADAHIAYIIRGQRA